MLIEYNKIEETNMKSSIHQKKEMTIVHHISKLQLLIFLTKVLPQTQKLSDGCVAFLNVYCKLTS